MYNMSQIKEMKKRQWINSREQSISFINSTLTNLYPLRESIIIKYLMNDF